MSNIINYLSNINTLKSKLSELLEIEISYDKLDMVLWHIGKVKREHLSLVLSMSDYMIFATDNDGNNKIEKIYETNCYKENVAMRLILDYLSI